jgi:hypothetical protein
MTRSGDVLRVVVVVAAGVAALGSAASNQQQQPSYYTQPPAAAQPAPQSRPQYTPCEHACGQISRCNLSPYNDCLAQCRQNGTEQQPGGPEQLSVLARTSCHELQAALQQGQGGAAPPPSTQQPPSPSATAAGGIEADYAVPAGFTQTRQGAWVLFTPAQLTDKTPCVYGLGPARGSSGSLENDALAALLEPVPGFQRDHQNPVAFRGSSAAGWAYHGVRASVHRMGNAGAEYLNVMAMAFPAGAGRVNILFGFGSNVYCMADDAAFAQLFHSLRPHGWASDGGAALRTALLGGWRMNAGARSPHASRSIAQAKIYVFRQDGRYFDVLHTTTELGLWETVRTSTGDGSWVLRDGVLVMTPDRRDRGAQRYRVRVFDDFSLGRWWRKMTMIGDGSTEHRELELDQISMK